MHIKAYRKFVRSAKTELAQTQLVQRYPARSLFYVHREKWFYFHLGSKIPGSSKIVEYTPAIISLLFFPEVSNFWVWFPTFSINYEQPLVLLLDFLIWDVSKLCK